MGPEVNMIHKIAKGDLEALESLYHTYKHRLFVYLFRMLNDRESTEEVINDVVHSIWRGAAKFEGKSLLSTWIFGIARKKALTFRARLKAETSDLDNIVPLPDHNPNPEDKLIRKDLVKRALRFLSPEHREVIELTFYSGFSYKEISEIIDCPVNTVKTRMFHARQQLRKSLSG